MKCGKFCKSPCKICYTPVTKQNGLQCQGACRAWVHFKCLNYTPGKIEDIRAGLIKVMCPCPNCETEEPKEVLINPPVSCTNSLCLVNLPLSSEAGSPTKNYPIPSFDYDSDSCPDCILPKYSPAAKRPSTPKSGNTSVRCFSSEVPSCTAPNQQESRRSSCLSNCSSKHRVDGLPTIVPNQSRSCSNCQNNLEHSGEPKSFLTTMLSKAVATR